MPNRGISLTFATFAGWTEHKSFVTVMGMRMSGVSYVLSAVLAVTPAALFASKNCTADAMIVFDGSGSMAEMGFNDLSQPRILDAREAVGKAMPFIAPVRRVGLITYGPGTADACSNIDVKFGPQPDAGARITGEIDQLEPSGETPLTDAVQEAAEVLDFTNKPGLVVLVTDGKETCGGAPCQLAASLAADAKDLTVHVIGFKVRSDHFGWNSQVANGAGATTVAECLADMTGGQYVAAETVEDLSEALEQTLGCRLISGSPVMPWARPS